MFPETLQGHKIALRQKTSQIRGFIKNLGNFYWKVLNITVKLCAITENNLFPKGPEGTKEVDVEQKNQSCCA